MCAVSAIMDYGREQFWPNRVFQPQPTPAILESDRKAIQDFLKMVEAAKEFDKSANQPHCEDPEKIKLLERIEKRLAAIEAELGIADAPA